MRLYLKKTLPYWKYWKKTERLQALVECEIFFIWKQKKLLIKLVEKWTELLIILQKKEPEVLEKLIKLVEKWTELLIILQKETNFLKKEPEVLEKLK